MTIDQISNLGKTRSIKVGEIRELQLINKIKKLANQIGERRCIIQNSVDTQEVAKINIGRIDRRRTKVLTSRRDSSGKQSKRFDSPIEIEVKTKEVLGKREEEIRMVPLNKQMGFKSKLKIGQSNPSKKINEPMIQRVEFDKHIDGSKCLQDDLMKFKKIIFLDRSEMLRIRQDYICQERLEANCDKDDHCCLLPELQNKIRKSSCEEV
ncbi:hypothetical protein OXYTRIMIC_532 [Oxytricha trifallax]|uniref:Uncharacterized protein n=1 Tax=Oxytricha trifallax TaxID=1172189 RepID=A0A073I033_9SPIT|nr:hypothetical protein OXYTRIMIC_532 [Oxytricha trifallax]